METMLDALRHRLPHLLLPLAETPGGWADPWLENPWANFITDQLRTMAAADICWFKTAALFPALDSAPLTEWDLRRAVPGLVLDERMGLDDLMRMEVPGAAINAICEQVVVDLPYDLDPTIPPSACLPGNTHLQASGLRVSYDLARPAGARMCSLVVDGRPVDPQRTYTVVAPGFLAKGYSGYRWFHDGVRREVVGKERALLLAALACCTSLPSVDGRHQYLSGDNSNRRNE